MPRERHVRKGGVKIARVKCILHIAAFKQATQSADFIHGEADQSCVQYRKNDAVDVVRFGPAIGRFLCTSADYVVDGPDNYMYNR